MSNTSAPKALIAGEWSTPAADLGRSVCDANTGEALFRQGAVRPADVDRAIACAERAHREGDLFGMGVDARAELLFRSAAEVETRVADIAHADAQTTGVTLATTEFLAQLLPHVFRASGQALLDSHSSGPAKDPAKDQADSQTVRTLTNRFGTVDIRRLPLGPAAVVCPWNAPSVIAAHKIASALAAGCPVIVKPSEWAPSSCQVIVECLLSAGVPARAVQIVHGGPAPAAQLASDDRIRALSFTGGPAGGRALAALCAQGLKPIQLELGGNNPLIVLPGADIDAVREGIVGALTSLNGQWCRALGRLFIHDSVFDQVWEAARARLGTTVLGNSLDRATEVGPLAHESHRETVAAATQRLVDGGGTAHCFGSDPGLAGWFYRPTLITGLEPAAADREIFGPVAAVHGFSANEELVEACNASTTGLAAYVYGPEHTALDVARRLRIGQVKLNGVGVLGLHHDAPRAAWRHSGLGDEGNAETLEFFRGTQVLGPAGPIPGSGL